MDDLFEQKTPRFINVRVTPKAKSQQIKKVVTDDQQVVYKIYVTVVPEDGKANKAVIELIAKELGIAKSKVVIIKGHTSRDKIIRIDA